MKYKSISLFILALAAVFGTAADKPKVEVDAAKLTWKIGQPRSLKAVRGILGNELVPEKGMILVAVPLTYTAPKDTSENAVAQISTKSFVLFTKPKGEYSSSAINTRVEPAEEGWIIPPAQNESVTTTINVGKNRTEAFFLAFVVPSGTASAELRLATTPLGICVLPK